MNPKVLFHNHPTDPTLELNSFVRVGEFKKEPNSAGSFEISSNEEIKSMSVRTLRNIFLQQPLESRELNGMPTVHTTVEGARIADNMKSHYEGSEGSEATFAGSEGGKSVKELRQLYEAKVKALSSSVKPDHPCMCACFRPTTAGSEERQNTVSVDMPHPEGRYVFREEPVESNPTSKWYVASSKIKEIPNGLRLSIVVKNGSQN